jgi:hypothetical protein
MPASPSGRIKDMNVGSQVAAFNIVVGPIKNEFL